MYASAVNLVINVNVELVSNVLDRVILHRFQKSILAATPVNDRHVDALNAQYLVLTLLVNIIKGDLANGDVIGYL